MLFVAFDGLAAGKKMHPDGGVEWKKTGYQ